MKKELTNKLIKKQLKEDSSDVLNYINRLEGLFEKTSNEYLFLKNKIQKIEKEELDLIMLKQESINYYENLMYLKRIYNKYLNNK